MLECDRRKSAEEKAKSEAARAADLEELLAQALLEIYELREGSNSPYMELEDLLFAGCNDITEAEQIRRQLLKIYHPDQLGASCEEMTKVINTAFDRKYTKKS